MMFTDNIFLRALSTLFSYNLIFMNSEGGDGVRGVSCLGPLQIPVADPINSHGDNDYRPDDDLLDIVRPAHLLASVS